MTDPAVESRFDADAFLTWEAQQPEKHEYVGGEAFAMVGARREHVVVSGNFFAAFKERLRGGACQAYVSDLKLRVEAADAFFYPDVMVSCDRGDQSATLFITETSTGSDQAKILFLRSDSPVSGLFSALNARFWSQKRASRATAIRGGPR